VNELLSGPLQPACPLADLLANRRPSVDGGGRWLYDAQSLTRTVFSGATRRDRSPQHREAERGAGELEQLWPNLRRAKHSTGLALEPTTNLHTANNGLLTGEVRTLIVVAPPGVPAEQCAFYWKRCAYPATATTKRAPLLLHFLSASESPKSFTVEWAQVNPLGQDDLAVFKVSITHFETAPGRITQPPLLSATQASQQRWRYFRWFHEILNSVRVFSSRAVNVANFQPIRPGALSFGKTAINATV